MLEPWTAERILSAYDAELSRVLTTDAPDDLSRLFEELGEAVSRLVLELTPELRDFAFSVEGWHRRKWRDTVLSASGVDLATLIGPQDVRETIDRFLARNTALVRDVSAQARGRIADAVFRGLQQRTPAREVGKEITEAIGMARTRANRIAADQAVKLGSALDAERQRQAGLTVWRWQHSGKRHPREYHRDRSGNLYADEAADRGTLANGDVVREPPASDDLPGVPPFCGCVRVGVLVLNGVAL